MAPRNVLSGSDYAAQILLAIRECSALVFLFSASSNQSAHCLREVEAAVKNGRTIIPVRLEDIAPTAGLEYRLSTTQWLDAFAPGFESVLSLRLIDLRSQHLDDSRTSQAPISSQSNEDPARFQRANLTSEFTAPLLCGRDRELSEVRELLQGVKSSNKGAIVLIGGNSGVGKSALARNLIASSIDQGFTVASATCESFLEAISFFPIRELMRRITDSTDLVAEVERIYGRNSQQSVMASIIESTTADPSARREAMLGTFANVVFGVSTRGNGRPLALLLDDLENVDAGTTDSLLCLLARLQDGPVLVVGTYRSDAVHAAGRAHPLLPLVDTIGRGSSRNLVHLELKPLTRENYPSLIESVLEGKVELPAPVVDQIWAETEGNPLFVREILRALRAFDSEDEETPRLINSNGVWNFAGSILDWQTPKSVEDAIGSNLSMVGDKERVRLETASVVGKRFSFDLVLNVTDGDEEELLEVLESCVDLSIIRELSEPDDTFEFAHSKFKDVLYQSISRIRRKRLHSKIADALISMPQAIDEDRDALIGEHLYVAQRFREAAQFLDRSASRHMALLEGNTAALLLGRLLLCLAKADNLPGIHRNQVQLRRVEALKVANEYEDAIRACHDLVNSDQTDLESRGWAFDHLGDVLWATGKVEAALESYEAAESVAEQCGSEKLKIEVYADLTELHEREFERSAGIEPGQSSKHKVAALEYLRRQYSLAQASSDPRAKARAYRNYAKKLRKEGNLQESLALYEKSLALSDPRVATHQVLISYAKTLRFAGEVNKANDVINKVLTWSAQTGARRSMAIAYHYRAMLDLESNGPRKESHDDLERALQLHEEIGYERGRWEVRTLLGEWHVRAGNWDGALREFRLALKGQHLTDSALVNVVYEQISAIDESDRATVVMESWGRHLESNS